MSKATEKKLNELHGVVAAVLTERLQKREPSESFDEDGNLVLGEEEYSCNPAMVDKAIKFLKDNSITADVEQDENMNNLREALAKKQKHSRLRNGAIAAQDTLQ